MAVELRHDIHEGQGMFILIDFYRGGIAAQCIALDGSTGADGAARPFDDWLSLLQFGSQLRQLAMLCEEQVDALNHWQENTATEIDEFLAVRLRDLLEHIDRVKDFATGREADIDSLVQLHFSAVAHRTNEIMRVLTVVSAIFLPLSLVAGIFGMNFEYMPELKWPGAYFVALGAMATLGGGLLWVFRRKGWF